MIISLNWLKEYVDLPSDLTPKQLAYDLTMSTVEVESVTNQKEQFENMVVGQIQKVSDHPGADKLKVTTVDIGDKENVQIVCGGTNLREEMLVPVALPGSKVRWHGEGDLVTLEETKIRGEKSFGMICAASEIGLESIKTCGDTEIVDLSEFKDIKPGQNLANAFKLDDVVLEIDNKSLTNRPDLWNHYGLARELSAIYNAPLQEMSILDKTKLEKLSEEEKVSIDIENKEDCQQYIGCLVKNIKIAESPVWLKKRLASVGSRSINNIVDITNFVMQDVGNPMHAFDQRDIAGSHIIVKRAADREILNTLDGTDLELSSGDLVISDDQKTVALAGIMGGANSEVKSDTVDIILESASFNAMLIRKTSQKVGVRTDASARFEKNLDPNFAEQSMLRALKLLVDIFPEAEIVFYEKKGFTEGKKVQVEISHDFLNKKTGREFAEKEVLDILSRLGFEVEVKNQIYNVTVPSWRATGDVSIPEDIVEEVSRIFGYDNFEDKEEKVAFKKAKFQPEFYLEDRIKNYLSLSCGAHEVFNYPWPESRLVKKYDLQNEDFVEISNPPSGNTRYLQSTLIPNLIKNIEENANEFTEFKIFELAKVFNSGEGNHDGQDKLPRQQKSLAGAVVGREEEIFFDTKGILEGLGFEFNFVIGQENKNFIEQDKYLEIFSGEEKLGWLGQMKNKIKKRKTCLFEIDFDKLKNITATEKRYQKISEFPNVERDFSFEMTKDIKWQDIKENISSESGIVKNIEFLSEYDLGDKKSVSFKVIFEAEKTLTDEEVDIVSQEIITKTNNKFNAQLR
jgi:phenylalanyl-tRNA synthetase beta chain